VLLDEEEEEEEEEEGAQSDRKLAPENFQMGAMLISTLLLAYLLLTTTAWQPSYSGWKRKVSYTASDQHDHHFHHRQHCSATIMSADIPQTELQRSKSELNAFAKVAASLSAAAFLRSQRAAADDDLATVGVVKEAKYDSKQQCIDSVSRFRSPSGDQEVILIGTAHISEESANLVRSTIADVKPGVVMIELDPKRVSKFVNATSLAEKGFDVAPSDGAYAAIQRAQSRGPLGVVGGFFGTAANKVFGSLIGRFLSQFYKSVEKLGFTSGGEFLAAIEEGKKVGARILLGDRDIDVTLSRLATAVQTLDENNLNNLVSKLNTIEADVGIAPPGKGDKLTKSELSAMVEGLKQRDTERKVAAVMKSEVPELFEALVGERDRYLAHSIYTSDAKEMVAVVGAMHTGGMEDELLGKYNYTKYGCFNSTRIAETVSSFHMPIVS
jgi:hypothetical protein